MALSVAFSSLTLASDIVQDLRSNTDKKSAPENFFEIGVGAGIGIGSSLTEEDGKDAGVLINASGSYNWNNFFIDVGMETSEPLVVGYSAYNSDNWAFDVMLGVTENGISQSTDARFTNIAKRQSSAMLGGRLTGYFGGNTLQVSLKHDVSGTSKGTVASAILGRNWQGKDWNFYGTLGLTVADAKINDYYFGVSSAEAAQTSFEAYDGKASVNLHSSLGATYAISRNWEFRTKVFAGSDFGDNDSPLFIKKRDFYLGISSNITYKF